MTRAGKISRNPYTLTKKISHLGDGELVRAEIPDEFQPLLQGTTPKIEIPPTSGLFCSGTIYCMRGEITFAEGVPGWPVYLFVDRSLQTDTVRVSFYEPDTLAQGFEAGETLQDWTDLMGEVYESGVPHFEEIKERLHGAIGDMVKIKMSYGITIGKHGERLVLVARGLCRDVYYEAAKIDGIMRYRTHYIGPRPSKTFDLTADQLWEELVCNTLADIPALFQVPKRMFS